MARLGYYSGMNELTKQRYTDELALVESPDFMAPHEVAFCLYYAQGCTMTVAARLACTRTEREELTVMQFTGMATKLTRKKSVKAYLQRLMAKLEDLGVADALEIQMFLTDAIRTPISLIDETHPLCQKKRTTTKTDRDGNETETVQLEMVGKMDALKTLVAMKGLNAAVKVDVNHTGGIMIVPMAASLVDWESKARAGQAALMQDAIDV